MADIPNIFLSSKITFVVYCILLALFARYLVRAVVRETEQINVPTISQCDVLEDNVGNIIKRAAHGPEWHIQKELKGFLETRGWVVEVMHGNAYQKGIPDLYLFKEGFGERWVDVKHPEKYSFTKAQRIKWPHWASKGIGIWILTSATQVEYDKLFAPPNWKDYWKESWRVPTQDDIDTMLDELDAEMFAG